MPSLQDLLKIMIDRGASDLHVTTGSPPKLRIAEKLVPVENCPSLTPEDTRELCYSVLTELQKQKFEKENEIEFSFGVSGLSRFRASVFTQRGAVAGAFRAIPFHIMTLQERGMPDIAGQFIKKRRGLVLVAGPAGSGRSTTLASMIDKLNEEREAHIVTVEGPIEFLHSHKKSLVNQREVNADTLSFSSALKGVVRQDPDIVMISELRDMETMEAAVSIAEAGRLVLAALDAGSATQAVGRIIETFPPHRHEQVRMKLALALEGVLSQQLLPGSGDSGRVLAVEILVPTPAVRSLIREDRLQQIYSVMQTGARSGAQTMNQSLLELYTKGLISADAAINYSPLPEEMAQMLTKTAVQKQKK